MRAALRKTYRFANAPKCSKIGVIENNDHPIEHE
jgi:hypothetical protein